MSKYFVLKVCADGALSGVWIDRSDELKALQDHVGGYVEQVFHMSLPRQCAILVNEEGNIRRLPRNPYFSGAYVGDVLVVRLKGDGWTSLEREDIEQTYALLTTDDFEFDRDTLDRLLHHREETD